MKLKRTKLKWKNINVKVASLKGFVKSTEALSEVLKWIIAVSVWMGYVLRFIKFKVKCIKLCIAACSKNSKENNDKVDRIFSINFHLTRPFTSETIKGKNCSS